ncbi:S-layer homology domain-containing protein [Paenisporosarcina sp. FSL H8-0542]|uniref:S-layer homology domain-containing protein n=1 Tax=Paenisporosarcina sp. FSL H8-0542 TaxID=2921401 RepID=UPI00315A4A9C
MKKVFSLLIAILLLLAVLPRQDASAASFSDVTPSYGFYGEIMFLLEKGVIKDSARYGVNEKVTREEVAVMVSKAVGLNGTQTTTPFKDVPKSLASSGYINSAAKAQILQGYPDGNFQPKTIVNRDQMAIFLARGFNLNTESTKSFKDISVNMASYASIKKIIEAGITAGYPDGTFKPNDTLTRGQISAFLARAMGYKATTANVMKVHFLDVDQGDSILIQSPNGKNMLIDGGKKSEGTKVVSFLKSKGVSKLDYVVATHPDADHIGGLISVLNSISIGTFVDSGKVHTTETYKEMLNLIDVKNIKYIVPSVGDKLPVDSSMNVQVLNAAEASDDNNEASIVLKMTYGSESFLFMGDAETATEAELVQKYDMKATVLKAGHHGSNTSTSQLFLNEAKPVTTILSYGKDNSYGHPHSEVMNRLKAIGTKIYNTVDYCDITVTTSGKGHTVANVCKPTTSPTPTPTPVPQPGTSSVKIVSKDLSGEVVGIKNTGTTTVNLNGWTLLSVQGNQTYKFSSYNLAAGETVYVTSGPNAKSVTGYLKWTTANIWLNSGDPAKLLNAQGAVVSELN